MIRKENRPAVVMLFCAAVVLLLFLFTEFPPVSEVLIYVLSLFGVITTPENFYINQIVGMSIALIFGNIILAFLPNSYLGMEKSGKNNSQIVIRLLLVLLIEIGIVAVVAYLVGAGQLGSRGGGRGAGGLIMIIEFFLLFISSRYIRALFLKKP